MKTDYRSQWPGTAPSRPEVAPEMRIGQLKYELRQAERSMIILEWMVFVELAVIFLLAWMVCAS